MDNNKTRQAIILGALLHDIGKALNRIKDVRKKHPLFSKDFVSQKEFKDKVKNWVDINIVETVCQRHHENQRFFDNELLVQRITDKSLRAFSYIVSRADNYSSFEREDSEKSSEDFRKSRLLSIFSRIDIGREITTQKYYKLKPLSPENVIPVDKKEATKNENAYEELIEGTTLAKSRFSESITNLSGSNFNHFFNGLLSILEENFWCIPSDTRFEEQDISLFDHLSTTSAIATCLYDYHRDDFDEEKIKNDELEKFILVGGDLSGIQKFIFEIEQTNPKRLSKTLRGRSFYLNLLTDVASLKILKSLDLPLSNKIIDAGGRFIILAPNTDATEKILSNTVKEIDSWFIKTFLGKLSLNIDYSVKLSGKDFEPKKFNEKLKLLNYNLEIKKLQKFKTEYFEQNISKDEFQNIYEKLTNNGVCKFCGIYPSSSNNDVCQICSDSEKIGKKLTSKNFICYNFEDTNNSDISILNIGIDFLNDKDINPNKYYLIEKIGDKEENKNFGYVKRYVANYIPTPQEGEICLKHNHQDKSQNQDCESLCRYCNDPCSLDNNNEDKISRKDIANSHLTFQCIATHSLKENKGSGVDHLSVFKADVDFLGMIFSLGINNLTISRFASLSRMLNYFFTSYLKYLIKNKFNKIYTVYAGGDDMLLIGPWEQILEFSIEMQKDFKKFTAENPNITISAGISLFRPHSQVKLATEIAENNLEQSKNAKKNKLTVFSTTVDWSVTDKLKSFKEFLNDEFTNEKSKINSAFLYRLLKYQQMFFEAEDEGKIDKLVYHALMTRDVRRNIEIIKDGKLQNKETIDKLSPLYTIGESQDKELMRNLKIPIFWTIYKNRGGAK